MSVQIVNAKCRLKEMYHNFYSIPRSSAADAVYSATCLGTVLQTRTTKTAAHPAILLRGAMLPV